MPLDERTELRHILRQFPIASTDTIESLGNAGGFSGAQLWRLGCSDADYCLRRWPKRHPTNDQLAWIHRVLSHAAVCDCDFLPVPLLNHNQQPFVTVDGWRYELAAWMPGDANFGDDPNDEKLNQAIDALARFHLASAQVSLNFQPSSNIRGRCQSLSEAPQLIRKIRIAVETEAIPAIGQLKRLVTASGKSIAHRLQHQLDPYTKQIFPVQPVIRDIWHDHLLFTDERLTGIVDFGAMQMDHISLDLARMLGSLVGSDADRWTVALDRYSQFRPLTDKDRQLIKILDQATVLLGSLNWLKWILLEGRQFESMTGVSRRVEHLVVRWEQARW